MSSKQDAGEAFLEEQLENSKSEKAKPTPKLLVDMSHLELERNNPAAAEVYLKQAIDLDHKYVPAYVMLSKLRLKQRQPDKAMEVLNDGIRLRPKSAEIWNELGVVHATMGNYRAAVAAGETAVQRDPKNAIYITNLGGYHAMNGDYEKSYKAYLKNLPAWEAHYRVAVVQYSQGKPDQSVRELELALGADPGNGKCADFLKHIKGDATKQVSYRGEPRKDEIELIHGN